MYTEQPFSEISIISYQEIMVLIGVVSMLILFGTILYRRNLKRRYREELSIFIELFDNENLFEFYSLLNTSDLKLNLYRSFYNVTRTLDEFHKRFKNKIPGERESGVIKILSKQIDLATDLLHHSEIAHLLYDNNETKISNQGMAKLQSFKNQFHLCLTRYAKRLRVKEKKPFLKYASGSPKRLTPRSGPILYLKL